MISYGFMEEGLTIVKGCRDRYDGTKRNPFNEYECGHWYARAMASYGLMHAMTGLRYDAVTRMLYVSDRNIKQFTSFLCTESGYGTITLKDGKINIDTVYGKILVDRVVIE